jgi:HD-like signal output (HDOD) protein
VETVTQAVNMIGYQALSDLVFATCTVELFKGLPPERLDMERFWLNSVACGVAARTLALHGPSHEKNERFFLTGLLHAIGKLVFCGQCPETYSDVLKRVEQDGLALAAAEEQAFGFNHAELGAVLLERWQLPESLWQPIADHLDPAASSRYRTEAEILFVARAIADLLQASLADGEAIHTEEGTETLQTLARRLDLAPDALTDLPGEINMQVIEMYEIMMPGSMLVY